MRERGKKHLLVIKKKTSTIIVFKEDYEADTAEKSAVTFSC